ncbi:MAG: hypothetical protein V1873_06150 [Verrucomicrobiota bacterium]
MPRGRGVLFVLALVVLVSARAVPADVLIFRPRIGVPAFAETGGVFNAEVVASAGLSSNEWTAKLVNDLRAWTNCVVEQAQHGWYVYNNSATGWQLRIRVPAGISPELFKLVVSHPSGGTATNLHAVQIVPALETDFYILHYADPQASASNALYASGMNSPYGSIQELYWHAPVFNLINPRFLFDTGDEMDDGDVDTANRYRQYLNAMETLTVPLLITRGNNDRGDFNHWKANLGQATYSITLGSFYIGVKDYNSNEQLEWFTNDYASSFSDPSITFRLFGQHYSSGGSSYAPAAGQYPSLMLVGHGHTFTTMQTSPYYVLQSGPAHNYGGTALFEFRKSGTNWLSPGTTNHPAGTRFYAVGDWGAPLVSNAFASANNGSPYANTATITNGLGLDFWDGRVRFLLRHARRGYQVAGGEKLAEYDYADGSNTAVLVRVNIARGTSTVVSVYRVDSDDDGMPDDWEQTNFHDLVTATATSDYDHDAQLDWEEYVTGSQPTNVASVWGLSHDPADAATNRFVIRWLSASNRLYDVFQTTSLLDSFGPLSTDLPSSPPENAYTDTVYGAEPASFYRVRVREPFNDEP